MTVCKILMKADNIYHVDNTSDHLPTEVCLSYPDKSVNNSPEDNIDISCSTPKVRWYKFSPDEINEKIFHTGSATLIFRRV